MTINELRKEAIEAIEAELYDEWSELKSLSANDHPDVITTLNSMCEEKVGTDLPLNDCEDLADVVDDYANYVSEKLLEDES